jgi:hypothetical protein
MANKKEEAAEAKPKQPQANGITRPKDGTLTGRVWAIADELSEAAGEPISRGAVMTKAEAEGLNKATIATQYGRWRQFHGLASKRKAPEQAAA